MKPLIIANWKMNPKTLSQAIKLAEISDRKNVILCPPFVFLNEIGKKLKKSELGAQNCHWEKEGAFTGEISLKMLKNSGVKYVILGHSERRNYFKETDEIINRKIKAALKEKLKIILCVGSKKTGKIAEKEIKLQIKKSLNEIKKSETKNVIIAYEPVWAISTTKDSVVAVPEKTKEEKVFIKIFLNELFGKKNGRKIKIIYGGSVDGSNIKKFIEKSEMDGVLVGAASLKSKEIKKIIDSCIPRK